MKQLRKSDSVDASPSTDPAMRLESLRFFFVEREGFPAALLDSGLDAWMQEVEEQIASLRERLNGLPDQYAFDSAKRWPGVSLGRRITAILTFQRRP